MPGPMKQTLDSESESPDGPVPVTTDGTPGLRTMTFLRRVNYLDHHGKWSHYWQTTQGLLQLIEPHTRPGDVVGNWLIVPEAKESEYKL